MEYSRAEKIKYWWRYKNYFTNQSQKYEYSTAQKGSILIVLPDGEVAFDLANLFKIKRIANIITIIKPKHIRISKPPARHAS